LPDCPLQVYEIDARLASRGIAGVSVRMDNSVVYLENEEAVARVLDKVRRIQSESAPATFMTSIPPMTSPVFRGVAVAHDPPLAKLGDLSLGQSRAKAMFNALEKSIAEGDNEQGFFQRVLETMDTAGFDPAARHLNRSPGGVP
jgi:hypothetical protein